MSAPVSTPFFASEFYSKAFPLFKNDFGEKVKVNPSGTIVLSWGNKRSCFQSLLRRAGIVQDSDLIAVHSRLKSLEAEIQNPASPVLSRLKREPYAAHLSLHGDPQASSSGLNSLSIRTCQGIAMKGDHYGDPLLPTLTDLSQCFVEANKASTSTLLKVINFIRRIFCLKPITPYHFSPIDIGLWRQRLKTTALLTDRERSTTLYLPQIQNNSSFSLPGNLTQESLQELELGFRESIHFNLGGKSLRISFTNGRFLLLYMYSGHERGGAALLNISERRQDASVQIHPLQVTSCTFSRALQMSPNSEYTIPLSQGSLQITTALRT